MNKQNETCVLFFPHPAVWAATGILFVVATLWARLTGFSVHLLSSGETVALQAYLSALGAFVFLAAWLLRDKRPGISRVLFSLLLFFIFFKISITLNYLGVRAGFPLADPLLREADVALGFDWMGHVAWVNSHPAVMSALFFVYKQLMPLIMIVFVYLAVTKDFRRLREYLILLFVTMIAADIGIIFLPALGPYTYLNPPDSVIGNMPPMAGRYWIEQFTALRAGTMNSVAFDHVTGLVSIPSYHTVAALLTTWALRGKLLIWPVAAINVLSLISTISIGGHYMADVLGGVVVFVLAIWAYKAWETRAGAKLALAVPPHAAEQGT